MSPADLRLLRPPFFRPAPALADHLGGNITMPSFEQAVGVSDHQIIRTALVTTTRRDLASIVLDRIGPHYWKTVVCGDDVGDRTKPHPQPYLLAVHRLGRPAIDGQK